MTKIRIRYSKGEELRFISHLDTLRIFQRAVRRAGLPINFSSGFTPHLKISFGPPLPVGYISKAEFADFGLNEEISCQEFQERLQKELPPGLSIKEVLYLSPSSPSIFSSVREIHYTIYNFPASRWKDREEDLEKEESYNISFQNGSLHLQLKVEKGRVAKVPYVLQRLFGLNEREIKLLRVERTEIATE